jgi:hypothetical protein
MLVREGAAGAGREVLVLQHLMLRSCVCMLGRQLGMWRL